MDWKDVCTVDTVAGRVDFETDIWDDESSCNYSSDGTKLLDAENFPEIVKVRPGTRIICDGVFAFRDYMAERRIGEKIPQEERVSNLEKAFLPEGLTHIGNEAFLECGWMKGIRLPSSLQYIGSSAFACCWELRSLACPVSLLAIGDDAFSNCVSLERVRLNKGLKALGAGAFFGCDSLSEIALPEGLEFIGDDVFGCCEALKRIFVPAVAMEKFRALLPPSLHRRLRVSR